MMIPEKYELFYPGVYTPEEQAAIDRLLSGDMGGPPGGPGGPGGPPMMKEQVYQKEMEVPIEDMKRYLDGILHLYDEGRTKVSIPELFGIVDQAKQKLIEKGT